MASYLDFLVKDTANATSKMRIPITAQAIPAGLAAYASAVAAAIFGPGLLSLGGYKDVQLVIPGIIAPVDTFGNSDVRDKWQASIFDGANDLLKFGVPARDLAPSLIVAGTQVVGDLSNAAFTGALSALENTGGSIHMVNPRSNSLVTLWGPVLATTRSRKRPRVGGSR